MLIDTSLLVRTLQPHHELCPLARKAIDKFRLAKRSLYLAPRNFVELWVVATRPIEQNGLGMRLSVVGKPAHDARLVAAMQVHGLAAILTFDKTGFSRYAGIEVVHPADVVAR
ncbi:MAG: type II toxin-antitoxin system VapC family toxin [Bryobacteraceae bacterium]